jgi:hypothetical protein
VRTVDPSVNRVMVNVLWIELNLCLSWEWTCFVWSWSWSMSGKAEARGRSWSWCQEGQLMGLFFCFYRNPFSLDSFTRD